MLYDVRADQPATSMNLIEREELSWQSAGLLSPWPRVRAPRSAHVFWPRRRNVANISRGCFYLAVARRCTYVARRCTYPCNQKTKNSLQVAQITSFFATTAQFKYSYAPQPTTPYLSCTGCASIISFAYVFHVTMLVEFRIWIKHTKLYTYFL